MTTVGCFWSSLTFFFVVAAVLPVCPLLCIQYFSLNNADFITKRRQLLVSLPTVQSVTASRQKVQCCCLSSLTCFFIHAGNHGPVLLNSPQRSRLCVNVRSVNTLVLSFFFFFRGFLCFSKTCNI